MHNFLLLQGVYNFTAYKVQSQILFHVIFAITQYNREVVIINSILQFIHSFNIILRAFDVQDAMLDPRDTATDGTTSTVGK